MLIDDEFHHVLQFNCCSSLVFANDKESLRGGPSRQRNEHDPRFCKMDFSIIAPFYLIKGNIANSNTTPAANRACSQVQDLMDDMSPLGLGQAVDAPSPPAPIVCIDLRSPDLSPVGISPPLTPSLRSPAPVTPVTGMSLPIYPPVAVPQILARRGRPTKQEVSERNAGCTPFKLKKRFRSHDHDDDACI